jgi:ABC-2 type transport system ATP-binding protein
MVEISQLFLGTVSRSFSKTWTSTCFLATFTDCWVKRRWKVNCLKTLPAWYSHGRACAPTVKGHSASKRLPVFLQEIFFVPEEVYMPAVTAKQFADSTAHFYPNFNLQQFAAMLAEFDVRDDKPLTKLSFGQQKKVMISFGLCTNTALLIMDEPTNGLDIPSKSQFRKIIASALTDDRCVIISTHQVRDLDNLIDTVLILHDRQIVVNQALDAIAEKVTFGNIAAGSTGHLYAEESMLGLNAISPNTGNDYGKVDMELLFNAVISNNKPLIDTLN